MEENLQVLDEESAENIKNKRVHAQYSQQAVVEKAKPNYICRPQSFEEARETSVGSEAIDKEYNALVDHGA